MLPEQRHQGILGLLKEKNQVSIADLASELQVSQITVRRDLEQLESSNQIIRIRGGAKLLDSEHVEKDTNFLNRRFHNQASVQQQEKKAIGSLAASIVQDDETILIDAGSTALELAKHLHQKKGVTAIVTTVNIAEELEGREGVTTIITGGLFRSRTTTLVNPIMDRMLTEIYADKVFIGVTAVSVNRGFTGNDFLESDVKRQLLKSGKEVYWLVDSTKINSISTIQVSPILPDHTIITDDGLPPDILRQLEHKCRVLVAKRG
jgi:DeoR/GlpR family transcriptional regulator of sugar metabolism